jgi:hypothetical protein
MKNTVFCDVTSCGSCKNRRFGGRNSIIRVTKIEELGTTLSVTSNWSTQRRNYVGDIFLRNVGSTRVTRSNIPEEGISQILNLSSFF